MKYSLIAIAVFILFTSFKFGEGTAFLKCKSESGRTFFTAELERCEYLQKAELTIDGIKESFDLHDKGNIIFDPANKVFTIVLESSDKNPKTFKFVKFWAIPSSFKTISIEKGPGSQFNNVYEFKAQLYGSEIRTGKEKITPVIEVNCSLDYQL